MKSRIFFKNTFTNNKNLTFRQCAKHKELSCAYRPQATERSVDLFRMRLFITARHGTPQETPLPLAKGLASHGGKI